MNFLFALQDRLLCSLLPRETAQKVKVDLLSVDVTTAHEHHPRFAVGSPLKKSYIERRDDVT